MKIIGYISGILLIALFYQYIIGEESYIKALIVTFGMSWLCRLHLHFLGETKDHQ